MKQPIIAVAVVVTTLVHGCGPRATSPEASGAPEADAEPLESPVHAVETAAGRYRVVYRTEPSPIPLNRSFDLHVWVRDGAEPTEPATGIALFVDGRMPHHRHGMTRNPEVVQVADGVFHVQGMLFHMPGRWELYFDVLEDGFVERAQAVVWLE